MPRECPDIYPWTEWINIYTDIHMAHVCFILGRMKSLVDARLHKIDKRRELTAYSLHSTDVPHINNTTTETRIANTCCCLSCKQLIKMSEKVAALPAGLSARSFPNNNVLGNSGQFKPLLFRLVTRLVASLCKVNDLFLVHQKERVTLWCR